MILPPIDVFYGVDFSGARLAGRNAWVSRVERSGPDAERPYRLTDLRSLEQMSGTADRAPALGFLVDLIAATDRALWALDFPFGLPVEIFEPGSPWVSQFELIAASGEDAYGMGLECLRRARELGGPQHIRRATDTEAKAPFDCYHYRIIYQTFYGMRDVLGPLRSARGTAVLPFHYRRLPTARRVLMEACPASTLKRLGLPHQNYKQPQGGKLAPTRRTNRRTILSALSARIVVAEKFRRIAMRGPGGDALDALIAAAGGIDSWNDRDHQRIARNPRYKREGYLYV